MSNMQDKEYIALLEAELARQHSYSYFHKMSYDLVENIIAEATQEIAANFEGNLKKLKSLCKALEDTSMDKRDLWFLQEATESMHEYITILQCEDRIFQILNGVSAATDGGMNSIKDLNIDISEDTMYDYGEDLVKYYTVQEQRDIALGNDLMIEEEVKRAAGTIELF